MNHQRPRIGYACNNLDIDPNTFKTCRIDRINDHSLIELITHNLKVLEAMIDYNIQNHNKMLRISSSLIPFASSNHNTLRWDMYFTSDFKRLKEKIIKHDIRISCHPGQYTVINSLDEKVVSNSIKELHYHHLLLELLSGRQNDKMILHIGGIYGNKKNAIERFINVYNQQSSLLRKHLVIENDDRLFTVEDVLYISSKTQLPVIFDNLHHAINPSLNHHSIKDILSKVKKTWSKEDGWPKMHYSQQAIGKRPGAHSSTIDLSLFYADYQTHYKDFNFDMMLEVKDKNRSFLKVDALLYPSKNKLEKEWAKYKYWVLARSHINYLEIRNLLKSDTIDPIVFYQWIDQSIYHSSSRNQTINAFEHMWGYFKKTSTEKEKIAFFDRIEQFKNEEITESNIVRYLYRLSVKYDQNYLRSSYYLNPQSILLTSS